MELAYAAQGMDPPTAVRPKQMRSHNVLEACELAKAHGLGMEVVETLYRAYWEQGQNVNEPSVLVELCAKYLSMTELMSTLEESRFQDKIVKFDDDAYAAGVYNVPTFVIDGAKYAEQPYSALSKAVKTWVA